MKPHPFTEFQTSDLLWSHFASIIHLSIHEKSWVFSLKPARPDAVHLSFPILLGTNRKTTYSQTQKLLPNKKSKGSLSAFCTNPLLDGICFKKKNGSWRKGQALALGRLSWNDLLFSRVEAGMMRWCAIDQLEGSWMMWCLWLLKFNQGPYPPEV